MENDHYYSQTPTSTHKYRELQVTLRGKEYNFLTDAGVFSKDRVDRGTRLLIEHMEIKEGDTILDLGCGYGPIGIVAANLAQKVTAYFGDVNERAVELTEKNLEMNNIKNAQVRVGDGLEAFEGIAFDVILSNPPIRVGKAKLSQLIEESRLHLKEGGALYMVARTKQGAKSLAKEIQRLFGNVEEVGKGGGYRVMCAIRR